MTTNHRDDVVIELAGLVDRFFRSVSFEAGGTPAYPQIPELFIDVGLLIKNSGAVPEISNVRQFIAPRQASVDAGELTRFHEAQLSSTTEVFGNVAHRFGGYVKSGTLKGTAFEGKGVVSTQFVRTPAGWRISSMAWDDERDGLRLDPRHQ